jgi:hypothetical protein
MQLQNVDVIGNMAIHLWHFADLVLTESFR